MFLKAVPDFWVRKSKRKQVKPDSVCLSVKPDQLSHLSFKMRASSAYIPQTLSAEVGRDKVQILSCCT